MILFHQETFSPNRGDTQFFQDRAAHFKMSIRPTSRKEGGMQTRRSIPLLMLITGLFFAGNVSMAFASQETIKPLLLKDAVALALADNPGLAAMKIRAEALAAVPPQKGALPDPRLSFNVMNLPLDSFDLNQEGMTQLQVGYSQMLPYPGKLALRETVAEHESTAARWAIDEMRLKLVRDVKTVWWNLYFTDRAIEIIKRNKQLLRQFVDVAQTKYKVGKGLQQDVLLAQLELSKLHDKAISLRGMRRNQEARLNALLDQSFDKPVQLPQRVTETLAEIINEKELQAQAMTVRPMLAVSKSKIDAARARLGLAKKSYSPDFMLGAKYGYRGGENMDGSARADFLSVMFSMNLPIFSNSRQDKAVDQRNSQVLQKQYQLDDARSMVAVQVSRALADYQRSREQVSLFKQGIIPQASQTVASMLAAYQVNKVDFLNLVRAQVTLFNYETRYWKALSQGNQALARLTAAVGKPDAVASQNEKTEVREQ